MQPYQLKPGVYIYDSFKYPSNDRYFMTAILAEISSEQYWREIPKLVKQNKPYLYTPINTKTPVDFVMAANFPGAAANLRQFETLEEKIKEQQINSDQALENLRNFDGYNIDPNAPPFPPEDFEHTPDLSRSSENEQDTDDIVIRGPNGQILNQISLTGKKKIKKEEILISIIDPIKINDEKSFATEHEPIVSFTEEEVLERLETMYDAYDDWKELLDATLDTFTPVEDQINEIANTIQSLQYQDPYDPTQTDYQNLEESQEKLNDIISQMSSPNNFWYGIPLINLGPEEIPFEDSYILQVDLKNNWTLNLTNTVALGTEQFDLRIDKQIPPDTKFIAGFLLQERVMTIFLKIDGNPKIYQKTISMQYDNDMVPQVLSYGVDSDQERALCGYIWDIFFWTKKVEFNFNIPSPFPEYPRDAVVFDFSSNFITGNIIHSISDFNKIAYTGVAYTEEENFQFQQLVPKPENVTDKFKGVHPWQFLKNSYIDRFFCREHFKEGSFTISWYQWLFRYPTTQKNFISDVVYNNDLSYDYTTFEVIITFNGVEKIEPIVIPQQVWTYLSLRFDKQRNIVIFSMIDFENDILEKVILEIGGGLEFELVSMFGAYNKDTLLYENILEGLSGMVMIFNSSLNDDELLEQYRIIKPYLMQYDPKDI